VTDRPGPSEDGGRRSWLPHLSRAGKWPPATVAAAAIGVLVPTALTGWLGTGGDDDDGPMRRRRLLQRDDLRPPMGLEANSGGGRIFSLEVSYAKGGD
jgi:hypothetical protein